MTERRYGEEEVREIFNLATTAGDTRNKALSAESEGLTLADLQRIGQEAGIEPTRVAQAAATLDSRGKPQQIRRSFGLPVGISRVVDLPRAPTDQEWGQLVSEFRTTFATRGQTNTSGELREWSHGNLHICVEPTARGYQLRLSTLRDDAIAFNGVSVLMGLMSVIFGSVVLVSGKPPEKAIAVFGMFAGMGLAAFAVNLVNIPRWARTRERQLAALAEQAVALLRGAGDRDAV